MSKPDKSQQERRGRVLLARRGRPWDEQQVAAHLMSCRAQMVCGLRRKAPWAGLDADTLDSCFGLGAAVIVRVAANGGRPDWRTVEDLEKAQIAAFRNQAFDHWKRVNARSRQGDRLAIPFDPERHAAPDPQMERLFAPPDLYAIRRDLLAEVDDPALRAFWSLVLGQELTFKAAGDQLGLTKAQVMARTRAGRVLFAGYLERRERGVLCRERGADIVARRAGTADAARAERAEAHLDSCYACSLVFEPQRGAFERGILGIAPLELLVRITTRAGDVASVAATRWTEAAAGARIAAAGLAAAAVVGSGVGLNAATRPEPPASTDSKKPAKREAPPVVREAFRTPALLVPAPASPRPGSRDAGRSRATASAAKPARRADRTTAGPSPGATPSSRIASREFSFETAGEATAPVVARPPATPPPAPPPTAEFAGP